MTRNTAQTIQAGLDKIREVIGLFWEAGTRAKTVNELDWDELSIAAVVLDGLEAYVQREIDG